METTSFDSRCDFSLPSSGQVCQTDKIAANQLKWCLQGSPSDYLAGTEVQYAQISNHRYCAISVAGGRLKDLVAEPLVVPLHNEGSGLWGSAGVYGFWPSSQG